MNILTIWPLYPIIMEIIKQKKSDLKKEDEKERIRLEKMEEEDLDEDELNNDEGIADEGYGDVKRERGSGPYRLRKKIEIRDDLYSMIFATCYHPEYVKHARKVIEDKDAEMEEIIADYKDEPTRRVSPYGVKVYPDKPIEEE